MRFMLKHCKHRGHLARFAQFMIRVAGFAKRLRIEETISRDEYCMNQTLKTYFKFRNLIWKDTNSWLLPSYKALHRTIRFTNSHLEVIWRRDPKARKIFRASKFRGKCYSCRIFRRSKMWRSWRIWGKEWVWWVYEVLSCHFIRPNFTRTRWLVVAHQMVRTFHPEKL